MALRLALQFLLINRYNGERAVGAEESFYLFYPLHLLVIRGNQDGCGTVENEMVQKMSYGCRLRMKKKIDI